MRRAVAMAMMLTALAGCIAVWGRGYDIEDETSESITIKFDEHFADLSDVEVVAREHCGRYRKTAVLRERTKSMWGITTLDFGCLAAKS